VAVIETGSTGKTVEAIQKLLNKAKASPKLKVDGIFGRLTDEQVQKFQKKTGLKVDGKVGELTLAALKYSGKMPEMVISIGALYTSSLIVLFGRVTEDLSISKTGGSNGDRFARIYGFSFDGVYFEAQTPVLFLVHGDGIEAHDARVPGPNPREKEFYSELRAWTVSRADETVRLDVDTGKFENLLLDTISDIVG